MRVLIKLLLSTVALLSAQVVAAGPRSVVGRVTCNGNPVVGASLSDGVEVVRTGRDGRYLLRSNGLNDYVFLSIPGNCDVQHDGLIPRHFVRLNDNRAIDTADFVLHRVDNRHSTLFVSADIHLTGDRVDRDLQQFHTTFLPDIASEIGRTPAPVYSLALGDLAPDVKWYVNGFGIAEFLQHMSAYPTPIYNLMGNHDNDRACNVSEQEFDKAAEQPYKRLIVPNYYSLNIGQLHIVMLDNIIACGPRQNNGRKEYVFRYAIDSVQMEWLAKDLATVTSATPLLVCMHVPALRNVGLKDGRPQWAFGFENAEQLLAMLDGFDKVHLLAGHGHKSDVICYSDRLTAHNLPSASAVSWKINHPHSRLISEDGSCGGYMILTLDGKNIEWIYKANCMSRQQSQMRIYDLNCVPERFGGREGSNALLVNIPDWDEKWSVRAVENGRELPVEQVWTRDPLYWVVRTDPRSLPTRPTAFLPSLTLHMFRVECAMADATIEVIATDRFGNRFVQSVERPKQFDWQMK